MPSDDSEAAPPELFVDSGRSLADRFVDTVARLVGADRRIRESRLTEYVGVRYDALEEKISDANPDDHGDNIRVAAWKDQQEELMKLHRHFTEGNDGE